MSMKYVDRLINNPKYLDIMGQIHELEKNRIFCHHGFNHLLDVARIAYLMNLEYGFGYEKEFLYLSALLHDIGRAMEYNTGVSHEAAGYLLAKELLDEIQYPQDKQEEILQKVANHRHKEMPKEGITKDNFFWYADKKARNCFVCNVSDQCNWAPEKRTMNIEW